MADTLSTVEGSSRYGAAKATETDAQSVIETSKILMTIGMIVGTIFGGIFGYWWLESAPGMHMPASLLLAAITGSSVGTAAGALIAGIFDVMANGTLDNRTVGED